MPKKDKHCPDCGTLIWNDSARCCKCYRENRWKNYGPRKYPDHQWCLDCGIEIHKRSIRCNSCACKIHRGTDEARRQSRANLLTLWDRPEFLETVRAAHRTDSYREKRAVLTKKQMNTPESKRRIAAEMLARHKRGVYDQAHSKRGGVIAAAWKRGVYDGVFKSPSSLELMVAKALDACGVLYVSQHRLEGDGRPYDFFIPAAAMLVEVDGVYWHGRPGQAERDALKDKLAEQHGFAILRITEKELKELGALPVVMERILPICTCICGDLSMKDEIISELAERGEA